MSDVITRPVVDRATGKIAIERVQDVEDIIERNKALQTIAQNSDWGRHIASIPNIVMEQWLNEEHARGNTGLRMFSHEFDALIKRKLQDPDWRWLRTDGAFSGALGFGS